MVQRPVHRCSLSSGIVLGFCVGLGNEPSRPSAGHPRPGTSAARRHQCRCIAAGGVMEHGRGAAYQPLTLTTLSALLAGTGESQRWRLIAEFLDEYRAGSRPTSGRVCLPKSPEHGRRTLGCVPGRAR